MLDVEKSKILKNFESGGNSPETIPQHSRVPPESVSLHFEGLAAVAGAIQNQDP